LRRTILISIVCALGLLTCPWFLSFARAQRVVQRSPIRADNALLPALPAAPDSQQTPFPFGATFSLGSIPAYNSYPGASATIYLDFDGDFTPTWGTYHPGTTPAYDTDGDPTSFSQEELDNIYQIWSGVSEMFSPFNINITTVDPGTLVDRVSMRVVIGGDGKNNGASYWPGARAGGIGYIGAFSNSNPNTVYVFPGNLRNGVPRFTAMAAAHETGHAFALEHQSEYIGDTRVQEYSDNDPATTGDGTGHYSAQPTAPIMGVSYFADRGLWWYGTSTAYYTYQDDLSTLGGYPNNFGYRPDDHGSTAATATPMILSGEKFLASGVIETIDDQDRFSFVLDADATAIFELLGAPYNQMLDPSMVLYASDDSVLQMASTTGLSELMTAALPAGSYTVGIFSEGNYGDIGQYFLTVTIPEPHIVSILIAIPLLHRRRRARA
jgi:hypothetical protein